MNKLQEKDIQNFLKRLGLKNREALLYITLVRKGPLTTVELTKQTNIPRTSIYRFLENLKDYGLVEEMVDEFRTKSQTTFPEQIEVLIKEKESNLKYLKNMYPQVAQQLSLAEQNYDPTTKVKFYRGKRGIQRMLWNMLQAKHVCGYSYRRTKEIVGERFYDIFKIECLKRGLILRDLYSDSFLKSTGKKKSKDVVHAQHCVSRYIPSNILDINLQTDIYKDVVAIYNWHEGEIFGIEIYNRKNAQFQKQIFETLWKKAANYKPPEYIK